MDSKAYYQCPMKCEGNKIYNEPGNCPVCNMHLVPVKEQKMGDHRHSQAKGSHHHDHQHLHEHEHHEVKDEGKSGGK